MWGVSRNPPAKLTIEVVAKSVAEHREKRVERGVRFLEWGKSPTPSVTSSLAARLDLVEQSPYSQNTRAGGTGHFFNQLRGIRTGCSNGKPGWP